LQRPIFSKEFGHAGGPNERLRLPVVVFQVLFDGLLQFRHAVETAVPNALRDLTAPAFHQIEPGSFASKLAVRLISGH
jgi:hypothetical protein